MTDFWKIASAILTAGGILLGVGRYVGNIEQRIEHLEQQGTYLHGSFELPRGAK